MRITHRRCRHQIEGLADTAWRQTERAEDLAEDLRAADHQMEEIRAACEDLEYALTEADIPAHLRERLAQLQRMRERAEPDEDEDMPVLI